MAKNMNNYKLSPHEKTVFKAMTDHDLTSVQAIAEHIGRKEIDVSMDVYWLVEHGLVVQDGDSVWLKDGD